MELLGAMRRRYGDKEDEKRNKGNSFKVSSKKDVLSLLKYRRRSAQDIQKVCTGQLNSGVVEEGKPSGQEC